MKATHVLERLHTTLRRYADSYHARVHIFYLVKTPGKTQSISSSDKFLLKPTRENNKHLLKQMEGMCHAPRSDATGTRTAGSVELAMGVVSKSQARLKGTISTSRRIRPRAERVFGVPRPNIVNNCEIQRSHHFETMGNHCWYVITEETSF